MFQFNGKSPTKQGSKYSLALGQNEGPFLIKDMMLTNPRNLHLLKSNQLALSTAQSILSHNNYQSPQQSKTTPTKVLKGFNFQQKMYDNIDERKKTGLNASENVTSSMIFQNGLMGDAYRSLDQYKRSIGEYKEGLKQMQANISGKPFDELRVLQTKMRSMYAVMREHSDSMLNENYQLQRDIDQLHRDKHNLMQQLGFYERRLEELEKTIGAAAKLDESSIIDSDDEQRY